MRVSTINSNHTNISFDLEIDRLRSWLETKKISVCGYRSAVLVDRVIQRLVVLGISSYVETIRDVIGKSVTATLSNGTKVNCTRAYLEIGSGKLTISWMQFVANLWDFLLHWAYCLVAIFTFMRGNSNNKTATLVFQVAEENLFQEGRDSQFYNFCRLGPIAPLRDATHLIVESVSNNISVTPNDITYARNPLIYLLRTTEFGLYKRCLIAVQHVIGAFKYGLVVFRVPMVSLVGKDIAYSFIARELDRFRLIESIVLTASSFDYQPLWTRELHNARVHMVWYSQSARPLSYRSDNVNSNMPAFRWIRVDTHWVWTKTFAQYLSSVVGNEDIRAVGPIVWYLPEIIATPPNDSIRIGIIDVPPCHDEVVVHYGVFPNYHNPRHLFSFIGGVVDMASRLQDALGMPVTFWLKTKRPYSATRVRGQNVCDKDYYDYLAELASTEVLSLEPYSKNLYSLISGSHLLIVYPFSSPAYIAESLNVPSIYYDPTATIIRHDFGDSQSLIHFANCPDDLLGTVVSVLRNVLPGEIVTNAQDMAVH